MGAAVLVFFVVTGLVMAVYAGIVRVPGALASQRLEQRLRELSSKPDFTDAKFVKTRAQGPLPAVDKFFGGNGSSSLITLIEQSGVQTTPSAIMVWTVVCAVVVGLLCFLLVKQPLAFVLGAMFGAFLPLVYLKRKRSARMKRFEEQFPEALDLMSRALRAGHAFQTALGMVAEETPAPVGTEFKKTFDQQNFGLPLRDALNSLAERVPILDVKFFVTAVAIQRETGGNLAEILDNLAHVVRERFKILRQVRVYSAHGRFTSYVLLAMPPALAAVLSVINPEHMGVLFRDQLGHVLLAIAIVMQVIGYFWIRKVIKIEV